MPQLPDPAQIIVLAAMLGTFLAILAFILPYVRPDAQAGRLKNVTRRRQELRAQRLDSPPPR